MIGVFKAKQGQRQVEQPQVKKLIIPPGLLRLKDDIREFNEDKDLQVNCNLDDSKLEDLILELEFKPMKQSLWNGSLYHFKCIFVRDYPHVPPKLECAEKIYHPNIDLEGKVCINILRQDWKPIFNLSTLVMGLNCLFNDPNPNDPLNQEAAEKMRNNKDEFEKIVKQSLKGISYQGTQFKKFL